MCKLKAAGWIIPSEEIETRYALQVLRLNVFKLHCGLLMAVTEIADICRNPKCRYWIPRR